MSVVDASAVAHLVLRLPHASAAEERVFAAMEPATAPDLVTTEVLETIRDFARARRIGPDAASAAVQALRDLPIARYPILPLVDRAWELRRDFSPADAVYVALAEALDTPLVTADARLARAVRDHSRATAILLS